MIRGLYTSALGMITRMQRMDVVSNNIANADTTSFKRDQVASQSFSEELMQRLNDPGLRIFRPVVPVGYMSQGVFVDDVYTDFSSGALRQTFGSLDLSVNGQGFFCVDVRGEELYTRDGAFTLRNDGALVTKDGGLVQGQGGAIILPNGEINISARGDIYVNSEYIDTIKMTNFADTHRLRKERDNYYRPIPDTPTAAFEGQLIQGYLENSNVNSVKEMVEMISLSRAYETNARMVTIHNTIMGRAVNDIGRK